MNKTLLSAALIAGFGVAAFTANAANVSSGTITITGNVVTSTCAVTVNGSANPSVALPTIDTGTLSANGSSAGWTAVTVTLTGCSAVGGVTKVTPYFWGSNINSTNGYLNNTSTGGSSAFVALSNAQSTTGALTLAGSYGAQNAGNGTLPTTGTATLTFPYFAGYVAPTGGASAGAVNTSVNYYLVYN
ncbi:MAG: fimbrial protein [Rhodanobacter sp.]